MKLIHISGPWPLCTNTFLLISAGGKAVAIDPAAQAQKYLDELKKENAVLTEENFAIAASIIEKASLSGWNYAELMFKDSEVNNSFNRNESKYTHGIQRLLKNVVLSELSVYGNVVTFYW